MKAYVAILLLGGLAGAILGALALSGGDDLGIAAVVLGLGEITVALVLHHRHRQARALRANDLRGSA